MAKPSFSLANSLTKFSGNKEENLEFFLNNLEQISLLEKWDINKKSLILKLNLSGQALKVVSEAKISIENEYNDIVKILKDKFLTKLNFAQIQCNFNSLKQQANQSIKSLAEEVEKITNDFLNINNNSDVQSLALASKMKAQKLLDAMRPDIRLEVMKRGETDFNNIAKIATDVERALSLHENHVNVITKSTEIDMLLKSQIESNKKIEELTQKIENLTKKQSSDQSGSSSNNNRYSCHICSKFHKTTDCWYYPTNSNSNVNNTNKRYQPYDRQNNNYRGVSRNFRGRRNLRNNNIQRRNLN